MMNLGIASVIVAFAAIISELVFTMLDDEIDVVETKCSETKLMTVGELYSMNNSRK